MKNIFLALGIFLIGTDFAIEIKTGNCDLVLKEESFIKLAEVNQRWKREK